MLAENKDHNYAMAHEAWQNANEEIYLQRLQRDTFKAN
jgi:hypothetical protein